MDEMEWCDYSSFSNTRGRDSHNKENRGRERDRGHGLERGGRGSHDNTSQTPDNVNPEKDKSMIKCYSCGKYYNTSQAHNNVNLWLLLMPDTCLGKAIVATLE